MGLFNWLEVGEDGGVIGYRYIRLEDDKTVVWGQQTARCGRWSYAYYDGTGMYFVEFSARGTQYWRKHILKQITDTTFVLYRYGAAKDLYDDEGLWHKTSVVHSNDTTIIMQKVVLPILDAK